MKSILELEGLKTSINGEVILDDINLEFISGKTYYLMGKNGAGKSTIGKAIMGHPDIDVDSGEIIYKGKDITEDDPDERSHKGIYLANQYPIEVPGVNLFNFLRLSYNSRFEKENQLSVFKFKKYIRPKLEMLNIEEKFLDRNLNEGFSGGEKKKCEILQMAVLDPEFVILDETDSGLDVDSLKEVFQGIKKIKDENDSLTLLVITHYSRIAEYLEPDKVMIVDKGTIAREGGPEIVQEIDEEGYR
jgi:Fe-S cluster assembly ATP-binding protein